MLTEQGSHFCYSAAPDHVAQCDFHLGNPWSLLYSPAARHDTPNGTNSGRTVRQRYYEQSIFLSILEIERAT